MRIEDREFEQICTFMLKNYGITLEKKRSLIEGRLSQTLTTNGFDGFSDYLREVPKNEKLQQQMVTKLTTNFTFFQREAIHYNYMVSQVVPELMREYPQKSGMKIWSAGCSSGDEAYTAAMWLLELSQLNRRVLPIGIQATDVSDDALKQAREGCYSEESLRYIDETRRKRYFEQLPDGHWKVSDQLTKVVHFSKLNLMQPFPAGFRYFDAIFCRNVMIYFTPEIRRALAKKFYDALAPGGYLFIGMSENIPAAEVGLKVVRPSVFKKEK